MWACDFPNQYHHHQLVYANVSPQAALPIWISPTCSQMQNMQKSHHQIVESSQASWTHHFCPHAATGNGYKLHSKIYCVHHFLSLLADTSSHTAAVGRFWHTCKKRNELKQMLHSAIIHIMCLHTTLKDICSMINQLVGIQE